jgi:hypothetical protein
LIRSSRRGSVADEVETRGAEGCDIVEAPGGLVAGHRRPAWVRGEHAEER